MQNPQTSAVMMREMIFAVSPSLAISLNIIKTDIAQLSYGITLNIDIKGALFLKIR